jgi:hypothetical protein
LIKTRKSIYIVIFFISSIFSQNILSLEYLGGDSLLVNLENIAPVAAFEIEIEGIEITGVQGGSAAEAGFYLSANGGSTTVGFSLTGATIPVGSGHMVTLFFDSDAILGAQLPCFKSGTDSDTDLAYCVLSGALGAELDVELGPCADGCFTPSNLPDELVCNFLENSECEFGVTYYQDADNDSNGNPNITQILCEPSDGWVINFDDDDDTCSGIISELDGSCCISGIFGECGICDGDGPIENFDCDGNCLVELDCLGVCDGPAVEDDCGICDGNNAAMDACGNCGGDCIMDLSGIIVCSGMPENLVIANCLGVCGGSTCMGCMDSMAENYNPDATIDDDSCEYLNSISESTISEIIHNCGVDIGESLTCDGEYDLSGESAAECPLYETPVTTTGTIVDYFDITPFNGPHSFTIEDANGNQTDFVVWPESSQYQDGFDITATDLNVLTQEPFGSYEVQITGELGVYCDEDQLLDINSEWQVTVEYQSDITIMTTLALEDYIPYSMSIASTYPNPFNPSINIEYSVASVGHVILQIIGLDGKHIDTITNSIQTEGLYNVQWTPINVSSGMYLLQLRANNLIQNKKIIYLK